MPRSLEILGHSASDGIYAGKVVYLHQVYEKRRNSGSPQTEAQILRRSIDVAIHEIISLAKTIGDESSRLIQIQVALLRDEELSRSAFENIERDISADVAWLECINHQILNYENHADEYFKARGADFKDIRDRVVRHIHGFIKKKQLSGAVYFGDDIAPTFFLETDWTDGGAIVLTGGSALSHVAMLARSRGIPMVVGLQTGSANHFATAIVDGGKGKVIFDANDEWHETYQLKMQSLDGERERDAYFLNEPALLRDGSRTELLLNISNLEELASVNILSCDGIGLVRSEFLFADLKALSNESLQFSVYQKILDWAEGKLVIIRTLDLGGDKFVQGLTLEDERNPFLGLRGIRLTLARRDVFRVQLRALARAAALAPLKVMFPMVSEAMELNDAIALLDQCILELEAENIACAKPAVGIMVEVPAVAIAPEIFDKAQFFSVGSNDLIQYLTATARDSTSFSVANSTLHPAVLKVFKNVTAHCLAHHIPIGLCGDVASDPQHLKSLLDCGFRSFSVAPARLARIKAKLREL